MEIKYVKNQIDTYVLEHPLLVQTGKTQLKFSPLELQIAFKLFLGSEKDLEDAKFLYELFKEHLDTKALKGFAAQLKVAEKISVLGEVNA